MLLIIIACNNSNSQVLEKDYSLAKVGKKINGVYIYIGAEPYYEYEYIATISVDVDWSGSREENFDKVIKKAMRKYSVFNGIIFHDDDLSKADLIRFKGVEISRGGIHLGEYVSFIKKKQLKYGKVVDLRDKIGFVKCISNSRKKKVIAVPYSIMNVISEEEFKEKEKEILNK